MRRDLLFLLALVLLIRLPFIDQAVQGDDVYYLLIAENAQVDPWHPMQMSFRLQGETVWAAGHTRPPLNAYFLALLLAIFGEVREVWFHLAYLLFSLVAVGSMYFLARRFCEQPLIATLLFATVPAFVVNGSKLEADIPLVALWTLGFALFFHERFALAAVAVALAGLAAYQSVFGVPILALGAWILFRNRPSAWAASLAAPAAIIGWQLFERAAAGTAPAEVLSGYFTEYGLLELERKVKSSIALVGHLGWMVSPLVVFAFVKHRWLLIAALAAPALAWPLLDGYSVPDRLFFQLSAGAGLAVLVWCLLQLRRRDAEAYLAAALLTFFAGSVAVFYAGSARYLLPLAPALALLVARQSIPPLLMRVGIAANLAIGLALAAAEYDYNQKCRDAALEVAALAGPARLWTNTEWGMRHYLTSLGAEPLLIDQRAPIGSVVAHGALAANIPYVAGGSRRELLNTEIATGAIPIRTVGRGSNSGYSSSEFGLLPFGLGGGVIDTLTAYAIGAPEPTRSSIKMAEPAAEEHLLSGFFPPPDDAQWRWMGPAGVAILKRPPDAKTLELNFHIPENAPARQVQISLDDEILASEDYDQTGGHVINAPLPGAASADARIVIQASPTHTPPGDGRELSIVVLELGFR